MRSALVSFVLLLCIVCASADTCSVGSPYTTSASQAVGSQTKLVLANNLGFTTNIQYVYTSSSTAKVDVSGCVDPSVLKNLGFTWSTTTDSIVLTASSTAHVNPTTSTSAPGGQVQPGSNAGAKTGAAPLTTFMALAFGLMLVIRPKSVSSIVVLMAILGVAVYAHADTTTNTITITITVPDSITSICSSASSCTQRAPGDNVPFINVLGDRYATMDLGASCDTTKVMTIPDGWRIATASDNTAFAAIAFNNFVASALILADGTAYTNGAYRTSVATNAFKTVTNGASTGYQVNVCPQSILLIQSFTFVNSKPTTVATLAVSQSVSFNGKDYASADNAAYAASGSSGKQNGGIFIATSSDWQVASADDSAIVGLAQSDPIFGCSCVVFADGSAYTNQFTACSGSSTAQLISVPVSNGVVVGVAGAKQRIVVSRASSKANTFVTSNIITYSVVASTNEYASLDNRDPYDATLSGCQSRFYTLPSDFTIATKIQTQTFLTGLGSGVYANTNAFVASNGAYDRDLNDISSTTNIVQKTINGVVYYNTNTCGKVLVTRTYAVRSSFNVGLKLLFISLSRDNSSSDIGEVTLFNTMMQATGIPYDWMPLTDVDYTPLYSASLPLADAQGNPKYYGIVMSLSNPKYQNQPVISDDQFNQIQQYMFLFGVRKVALNGYPTDYKCITGAGTGQVNGSSMALVPAFVTAHPDIFSGIKTGASFNTSGQYYSYITSSTSACTIENMLTMKDSDTDSVTKVVGAIVTDANLKIQSLQFFTGNADFIDHGPVLANMWIDWVTRGIWMGNRRVYLSPQIDDYFLTTGQYGYPDTAKYSVRCTKDDIDRTVSYLNGVASSVPSGSHINLVMAVNCASAEKNVTGLVAAAQQYKDYFWWESHTWSHLDFTKSPEESCEYPGGQAPGYLPCHNTTYDEAKLELTKNNDYIATYIFPAQGLDTPNWNRNSMITPAITGLFNPAALKAMYDAGMTCTVGDNSRPELMPPNPYLGFFTTKEVNGYDGIFIIPRYATEIYYNSATPENNMHQYNERYGPNRLPQFPKEFFDYNSTLDQLLDREAQNNFRHLAFFRHDPYMFHQCNLHHFPYSYKGAASTQWSLVTLWLQTIIDKYNTLLSFPLIGVKQQDLRDVYFARRQREFCGLQGSIAVSNGQATNLALTSTDTCTASLTGFSSCSSLSGCRIEQYATDNTMWLDMVGGAGKQVPINKAWGN